MLKGNIARVIILSLFYLGVIGLAQAAGQNEQQKFSIYQELAREKLLPFFQRAGVQFPPKQLAFLIFKKNQRLDLWAKDSQSKNWVQIRSFSILAASGDSGPKLKAGDQQVPEGVYHINRLNPYS